MEKRERERETFNWKELLFSFLRTIRYRRLDTQITNVRGKMKARVRRISTHRSFRRDDIQKRGNYENQG